MLISDSYSTTWSDRHVAQRPAHLAGCSTTRRTVVDGSPCKMLELVSIIGFGDEDPGGEVRVLDARDVQATHCSRVERGDAALVDGAFEEFGDERVGEVVDVVVFLESRTDEGMDDTAAIDLITEHVTDVGRGRKTLGGEPQVDRAGCSAMPTPHARVHARHTPTTTRGRSECARGSLRSPCGGEHS